MSRSGDETTAHPARHRTLLTGPPGVGKTTLIRQVAAELAHRRPVGFYTAEILDSQTPCLATVARQGGGLIAEVKQRPDVERLELTRQNRDLLAGDIVRRHA